MNHYTFRGGRIVFKDGLTHTHLSGYASSYMAHGDPLQGNLAVEGIGKFMDESDNREKTATDIGEFLLRTAKNSSLLEDEDAGSDDDDADTNCYINRLSTIAGLRALTPYLSTSKPLEELSGLFAAAFLKIWNRSADSVPTLQSPMKYHEKNVFEFEVEQSAISKPQLGYIQPPGVHMFPGILLTNEQIRDAIDCCKNELSAKKFQFLVDVCMYACEMFYDIHEMCLFALQTSGYAIFSGHAEALLIFDEEDTDSDSDDTGESRILTLALQGLERDTDECDEAITTFWKSAICASKRHVTEKGVLQSIMLNRMLPTLDVFDNYIEGLSITNMSTEAITSFVEAVKLPDLKAFVLGFVRAIAESHVSDGTSLQVLDLVTYSRVSSVIIAMAIQYIAALITAGDGTETVSDALEEILGPVPITCNAAQFRDELARSVCFEDGIIKSFTGQIAQDLNLLCRQKKVSPNAFLYCGAKKNDLLLLWNIFFAASEIVEPSHLVDFVGRFITQDAFKDDISKFNADCTNSCLLLFISAYASGDDDHPALTAGLEALKDGSKDEQLIYIGYICRKYSFFNMPAEYGKKLDEYLEKHRNGAAKELITLIYRSIESDIQFDLPPAHVDIFNPEVCDYGETLALLRHREDQPCIMAKHSTAIITLLSEKLQKDPGLVNTFFRSEAIGRRIEIRREALPKEEEVHDNDEDDENGKGRHYTDADYTDFSVGAAICEMFYLMISNLEELNVSLAISYLVPTVFSIIRAVFENAGAIQKAYDVNYTQKHILEVARGGASFSPSERLFNTFASQAVLLVDHLLTAYDISTDLGVMLQKHIKRTTDLHDIYSDFVCTKTEEMEPFLPLVVSIAYLAKKFTTLPFEKINADVDKLFEQTLNEPEIKNAKSLCLLSSAILSEEAQGTALKCYASLAIELERSGIRPASKEEKDYTKAVFSSIYALKNTEYPGLSLHFYNDLSDVLLDAYSEENDLLMPAYTGLKKLALPGKANPSEYKEISIYHISYILNAAAIMVHKSGAFPNTSVTDEKQTRSILEYVDSLENFLKDPDEGEAVTAAYRLLTNAALHESVKVEEKAFKTFAAKVREIALLIDKCVPSEEDDPEDRKERKQQIKSIGKLAFEVDQRLAEFVIAYYFTVLLNGRLARIVGMTASGDDAVLLTDIGLRINWRDTSAIEIAYAQLQHLLYDRKILSEKCGVAYENAVQLFQILECQIDGESEDDSDDINW
ncbi:hypothetical protein GMRT_15892 [Giardia muris]|uniref:Uncharacterized protein n=1 Tax=Giardia muris TaxID=5742 RepID=A0A4Z1TBN9_GIAMU|nr:hypothetical protein GMRT_15892 [Giardia muris]|eukprot:TNJ29941.1 hypothetical protein GMRT_15892 [Giardia muris]